MCQIYVFDYVKSIKISLNPLRAATVFYAYCILPYLATSLVSLVSLSLASNFICCETLYLHLSIGIKDEDKDNNKYYFLSWREDRFSKKKGPAGITVCGWPLTSRGLEMCQKQLKPIAFFCMKDMSNQNSKMVIRKLIRKSLK